MQVGGGTEQQGPRSPRAPDARAFRRLTRAEMIRAAHRQADAFGEPLTGLRFTADEFGSAIKCGNTMGGVLIPSTLNIGRKIIPVCIREGRRSQTN